MSENYREDVFSTSVRAGKRTYFFDVKATRGNDLFMTITESKRISYEPDGPAHYEKHKIFLYKEDFEGFLEGMHKAIDHIKEMQGKDGFRTGDSNRKPIGHEEEYHSHEQEGEYSNEHSNEVKVDVSFDDLKED